MSNEQLEYLVKPPPQPEREKESCCWILIPPAGTVEQEHYGTGEHTSIVSAAERMHGRSGSPDRTNSYSSSFAAPVRTSMISTATPI